MSAELRHRLTAILAADVAGYSKLMGADERATVAALDEVRAVFRREIEANGGRVVDMAGDSLLALFETATGALSAALAVQQSLETASASIPAERRMRVRIGLHIGEVMVKRDRTVYGNGVNVAARLQSIAKPGGICISQTLYETVKSKMTVNAEPAGAQSFKNIAEPVMAWHVRPSGALAAMTSSAGKRWIVPALAAALALAVAAGWWWLKRDALAPQTAIDAKSIAVLPFTNMSEDKRNAYFADGIQEELLTQLALLRELKVVSRTSAAEFRDTKKNLRQIGAELGVGSLVEGSVRRAGNRVRVSVQLIDARSDKHMWANTYDRELNDIFAIQSELAIEIAKALKVSLTPRDEARLARKPTQSVEAYELLLRQQDLYTRALNSSADTDLRERTELLSRAVELDPDFALAWARLAAEHARMHFYSMDRSDLRLKRAQEALDRALSLAPDDVEVRTEAGYVYYYGHRDFPRAAHYLEDLLRAAPNHVEALNQLAFVYRRQGKWIDANALHQKALAVDPRNVPALSTLAENYGMFRHFDESLSLQRRVVDLQPENIDAQARLYWMEYLKTGSFAPYDAWRATLPAGGENKGLFVWWSDTWRAAARRDFDAVVRLVDASPKGRGRDYLSLKEVKVLALLAKGDRSRAIELARSNLRSATADLRKQPHDVDFLERVLSLRAILGERDPVLDQYYRWLHEQPDVSRDTMTALEAADIEDRLYILLGERTQALSALRDRVKRPTRIAPNHWRVALYSVSLRDDPEFQELMNDPATNAPLQIVNMEPKLIALKERRRD